MKLAGKVAVVTGGASGIGEASAKTLAREGASVMVVDRSQRNSARVVEEIRSAGGTAEFVKANVAEPTEIERFVKETAERFGRIDILHNNAAFTVMGRVEEIPLDGWRQTLEVGVTGYWYAIKLVLPGMVERGGGSIVNTASISGLRGDPTLAAYNVAKAGVLNLTRTVAIENARRGIRCNAICPGPIDTPGFKLIANGSEEYYRRTASAVPMGRLGQPQEIANVVLFLASDESSYITGAAIIVDGGITAHTGQAFSRTEGDE